MLKNKIFFESKLSTLFIKLVFCAFGSMLIGFAIAFEVSAMLGNDSITVLYDGVRNTLYNLTGFNNLGITINIMNYTLLTIIFFIARKYVNIGTFIYALPLGSFTQLGFKTLNILHIPSNVLWWQIITILVACVILCFGIAIFVAVDMGTDPWTALVLIISKKINKPFKIVKIVFDITTMLLGIILGGKFGVATVFVALVGGPLIHRFTVLIKKWLEKLENKPKVV